MKITTWNVNGIRAAIEKGLVDWAVNDQADILCLQEIKARPEQVPVEMRNIPGYFSFWCPALRPGYSGVATFAQTLPLLFEVSLGEERFDQEGRLVKLQFPDFWLFNVYFPNGQRGHDRVAYKLDFYGRLLEEIDQIHARGEQVIVTGDFNTAHREIDLANPKQNITTSGFLPEERAWIDVYLTHGLVDAYRELYPDRQQYTWWTYRFGARQRNVGWRIDYFLLSRPLLGSVRDVIIQDAVTGSDHCPVSLIIE